MQETESINERERMMSRRRGPVFRRLYLVYGLLLAIVLVVLTVPLININRFQRRIVRSLSESLGRPIHLDRISLTVLPLPGLTIDNLVVGEDPAFGAEPFVRASSVRATLRVSSLWRRRIEFSRISFTEPSINLVKSAQGQWNLESILLQAARIDAAPTGQARASAAPRFPYIEATGARLNLKLGLEKTPISLTDAELALWLYSPREWRLRLVGKPMRTDTNVSETGSFQMEGTLGRAAALAEVPIDVKATWRDVPLGEASRVVLGHDAGLRGLMTLGAAARGTIGHSAVQATLHLADLRRADFVPEHTLLLDAECQAAESANFHTLGDVRCSWPPALASGKKTLALTGAIPELRHPSSATFEVGTPGIPAATLLDWLHIASPRLSPEVTATGTLTGSAFVQADAGMPWDGEFVLEDGSLTVPSVSTEPLFAGDMTLRAAPVKPGQPGQFVLTPVPLALGGKDFATLEGRFEASGYTLHLTGTTVPAKLLALGTALPQIGDGLADALPPSTTPVRVELTSTRTWGGPQTWKPTGKAAEATARRRR
jgi:AsmA protein